MTIDKFEPPEQDKGDAAHTAERALLSVSLILAELRLRFFSPSLHRLSKNAETNGWKKLVRLFKTYKKTRGSI